MAANAFSCLSTKHSENSDIGNYLHTNEKAEVYAVVNQSVKEVNTLIIQLFMSAQHEEANCRLWAEFTNETKSKLFYDKLRTFLKTIVTGWDGTERRPFVPGIQRGFTRPWHNSIRLPWSKKNVRHSWKVTILVSYRKHGLKLCGKISVMKTTSTNS